MLQHKKRLVKALGNYSLQQGLQDSIWGKGYRE